MNQAWPGCDLPKGSSNSEKTVKVLHITTAFHAGVGRAIETIIGEATTQVHFVLASSDEVAIQPDNRYSLRLLPASHFSRMKEIRRTVKKLKPDIVHAHSSFAGAYTRITVFGPRLVYQPHCYVFEDVTRSRLSRLLFLMVECLLSFRGIVTVAVSERERRIAARLIGNRVRRNRVVVVPNAPSISRPTPTSLDDEPKRRSVVMMGRICPQKDPEFCH